MRRILTGFICSMLLISLTITACKKDPGTDNPPSGCQDKPTGTVFSDIPNLDFEEWYSGKSAGLNAATYYNPSPNNFWTTPNNGSGDLGVAKVPITVYRVSGDSAYSGNYAVMIKTGAGQLLGKPTVVSGSVASGDFEVSIENPLQSMKFGKLFNKRPKKVTGYYQFYPVAGDSASAYCFVTKLDDKCNLDTIGFGRKIFYNEQSSYAQFEFNLEYKNEDTPDNIVIYFSSSEAGDEFKGQPGNTLFIDDVTVGY